MHEMRCIWLHCIRMIVGIVIVDVFWRCSDAATTTAAAAGTATIGREFWMLTGVRCKRSRLIGRLLLLRLWCRWCRRWVLFSRWWIVFARSSAWQMTPLYKFIVIDHPKWTEIILISYKTFMQRQIRAYRILWINSMWIWILHYLCLWLLLLLFYNSFEFAQSFATISSLVIGLLNRMRYVHI